jgi:hypothetical protein
MDHTEVVRQTKLTVKQEKFVQAWHITGNAAEAYRQAFDCRKMKPATIQRKATELSHKGTITARLRELQDEAATEYKCTVFSLAREFDAAAIFARSVGQAGALISALEKKAKLFRLFERDNRQESGTINSRPTLHPALQAMIDYRSPDAEDNSKKE